MHEGAFRENQICKKILQRRGTGCCLTITEHEFCLSVSFCKNIYLILQSKQVREGVKIREVLKKSMEILLAFAIKPLTLVKMINFGQNHYICAKLVGRIKSGQTLEKPGQIFPSWSKLWNLVKLQICLNSGIATWGALNNKSLWLF